MIAFDFDGVIADSQTAIQYAIDDLARQRGVRPLTQEELRQQSMKELFRYFKIKWYEVPGYVRRGREVLHENRAHIALHEQIVPTLEWAQAQKRPLAILSSNTRELISAFVAEHLPSIRFNEVVGKASLFGKHRAIRRLLRRQRVRYDHFIYVGDEVRDIAAARRVGVQSIAVTWGKDNEQLLDRAGPTRRVASGAELLNAIRELSS